MYGFQPAFFTIHSVSVRDKFWLKISIWENFNDDMEAPAPVNTNGPCTHTTSLTSQRFYCSFGGTISWFLTAGPRRSRKMASHSCISVEPPFAVRKLAHTVSGLVFNCILLKNWGDAVLSKKTLPLFKSPFSVAAKLVRPLCAFISLFSVSVVDFKPSNYFLRMILCSFRIWPRKWELSRSNGKVSQVWKSSIFQKRLLRPTSQAAYFHSRLWYKSTYQFFLFLAKGLLMDWWTVTTASSMQSIVIKACYIQIWLYIPGWQYKKPVETDSDVQTIHSMISISKDSSDYS